MVRKKGREYFDVILLLAMEIIGPRVCKVERMTSRKNESVFDRALTLDPRESYCSRYRQDIFFGKFRISMDCERNVSLWWAFCPSRH